MSNLSTRWRHDICLQRVFLFAFIGFVLTKGTAACCMKFLQAAVFVENYMFG